MSAAEVEAAYPKWREQVIGHTLHAGELTFTDCAALLEDMASGGYPYKFGEDRVAVRIAIVARAAELLRTGDALAAALRTYGTHSDECSSRRGTAWAGGGRAPEYGPCTCGFAAVFIVAKVEV